MAPPGEGPTRSATFSLLGRGTVLQVRTKAVYGLTQDYKNVYLQISLHGHRTKLSSAKWSVKPDGTVAADFYVRLPLCDAVDIRLVPTAPAGFISWLSKTSPTLHASLDVAGDAAAAAEAQQGLVAEGLGGSWRSKQLTLRPNALGKFVSGHQSLNATLELDYCLVTLPPRLARLPELDLAQPLARPLHSYAHGGFMGAALSLLADPQWSEILLQSMGADEGAERLQAVTAQMAKERGTGETAARRELLPQMLVLENSPVLCAYGSVRSGCTLPPKEALAIATATAGRMAPGPYLWHGFGLPPSRLPLMLRPFAPAWQRGPGGAWPVLSKYGYSPVGLEWDLWLSPDDPADLTLAVVDHGTPGDLVQQAVAMALRCQGVAEAMGRRHNQTCGISPKRWLIDFATALNKGQTTDPGKAPEDTRRDTATTPLPLYGPGTGPGSGPHDMPYTDGTACPALQTYLRLTVSGLRGLLDPSAAPLLRASSLGVRVRVTGNTHTHTPVHLKKVTVDAGEAGPAQQAAGGAAGGGGGAARGFTAADIPKGKASSLYPVERADLRGSLLVVEVFDSRDHARVLARSALPLATLEGRGGAGRVFLVGALQQRKAAKEAEAAGDLDVEQSTGMPRASFPTASSRPEDSLEKAPQGRPRGLQPGPIAEGLEDSPAKDTEESVATSEAEAEAVVPEEVALGLEGATDIPAGEPGAAPEAAPPEPCTSAEPAPMPSPAGDVVSAAPPLEEGMTRSEAAPRQPQWPSGPPPSRPGAGTGNARTASVSGRMSLAMLAAQNAMLRRGRVERMLERDDSSLSDAESDVGDVLAEVEEHEDDDFEGQDEGLKAMPSSTSGVLRLLEDSFRVCEDAAAAEAALKALAGEGKCTVAVELSWETWSTLKAAQELCGLPLHIAQSCTAMLSAPGGLFLDVKSGYSTAPQLRSFASSLMGIGINVKAICSFVPRQIDFEDDSAAQQITEPTPDTAAAPTPAAVVAATGLGPLPGPMFRPFDTVLFFHGLNGLELACEAGRVPPGTCVLFNGASMLYEDPGAAVEPPEGNGTIMLSAGAAGTGAFVSGGCLPCLGKSTVDADTLAQGRVMNAAKKQREKRAKDYESEESGGATPANGSRLAASAAFYGKNGGSANTSLGAGAERREAGGAGMGSQILGAGVAGFGQLTGGGGTAPLESLPALVDKEAWRRYCTVIKIFKVYGGIYVQEPDCCPAALDALIQLTNTNPGYLPLGFAYGHLGTKAVSAAGHVGRGMAAQQLMEELQSRRKLSRKVEKWIRRGVHVGADDQVYLSWGRRLLTSTELLYLSGQYLVLRLLADYDVGDGDFRTRGERLMHLVDGMGGFCFLFYRFWRHYESFSPLTLDELGFNLNHTKAFIRLLRNRGALAAMGADEKAATAAWLVRDRSLRLFQQLLCFRRDRHKFVREALVCLVESSTRTEYDAMLRALGGEVYFLRMLTGWTHLRGLYAVRRIRACQAVWEDKGPDTIPITQPSCRYGYVVYARRLPGEGELAPGQGLEEGAFPPGKEPALWRGPGEAEVWYTADPRHSRHKSWQRKAWRLLSKWGCCVSTWFWNSCCWLYCGCCYSLCVCPVLLYPYCRNRILPVICSMGLTVLWLFMGGIVIFIIWLVVVIYILAPESAFFDGAPLPPMPMPPSPPLMPSPAPALARRLLGLPDWVE
ncbi:hypothetical protein HYH03_010303 [Edaphochlamys debaryana]|uniref:Uncharacterized protein n=1 Tax=Edaphochlamys debaryana TaxID=47281 RepID=A0A835XUA8_9CHLO|nr:hypothetical protein HYH03_010303 [Edaphochlamys debaryana]|eukprot:KAG2491297.1 hypothetical protein HYH03_010303 [Edaphochlamys debaryana]